MQQVHTIRQANAELADPHPLMDAEQLAETWQVSAPLASHTLTVGRQPDLQQGAQALQADLSMQPEEVKRADTGTDLHPEGSLQEQLQEAQAVQLDLLQQLQAAEQASADLADAHTLTEGTLLEQLQEAQAEQRRLEVRVQHLEGRHAGTHAQLHRAGRCVAMPALV